MKYTTKDGIEFYCLPDNARCTVAGVHPDDLDECPIRCGYDNDTCVPEECEHYTEE